MAPAGQWIGCWRASLKRSTFKPAKYSLNGDPLIISTFPKATMKEAASAKEVTALQSKRPRITCTSTFGFPYTARMCVTDYRTPPKHHLDSLSHSSCFSYLPLDSHTDSLTDSVIYPVL